MNNPKQCRNYKPTSNDGKLWYRIPGFDQDEVYISELGNVICNGRLCKPNYNCKGGYGRVRFLNGRYKIHQLVGYVILGERELQGLVPHHMNGNPGDNRFANIGLTSPEFNTWLATTTRFNNKVIRYAVDNGYPGFDCLADTEQKYLESEFLAQGGDIDALTEVYLEYSKDKRIHMQPPANRTFIRPRTDEYVGISLQELEDRLMKKNEEKSWLPRHYHRDNAIRIYLKNFLASSSISESKLNAEMARNLLIDRSSTLCSAIRKILREENLGHKLRVEDRGSGQKYLVKL